MGNFVKMKWDKTDKSFPFLEGKISSKWNVFFDFLRIIQSLPLKFEHQNKKILLLKLLLHSNFRSRCLLDFLFQLAVRLLIRLANLSSRTLGLFQS